MHVKNVSEKAKPTVRSQPLPLYATVATSLAVAVGHKLSKLLHECIISRKQWRHWGGADRPG